MFEIVKGDLLEAKEKYIAHQCNATSNQAGGLAHYLFKRFPYANIYKHRPYPYKPTGPDFPGHFVLTGNGIDQRFVINMLAQYYPGDPVGDASLLDSRKKREAYFTSCLVSMAQIKNMESIAFPFKIGCGLAGGDWDTYLKMLQVFDIGVNMKQNVRVVVYDNGDAIEKSLTYRRRTPTL